MEDGVRKRGRPRGRKRRWNDVQNVEVDRCGKKQAVVSRPIVLLGRYVRKEFEGNGMYLGKVILYDSGLYKVVYEDGDCEDFDSSEVKAILFEDGELSGQWLKKKKKLDKLIARREAQRITSRVEHVKAEITKFERPVSGDLDNGCDSDSVSGLSEDYLKQDSSFEVEVPLCPAPHLPPSSNSIGIPEEYVSYLLSVYSFLRSFSIRLFLSPFGFDDFVGALNCSAPNTLLDSIHVALMRALRRHLRKLSSDNSMLASKCLRNIDWSLLDTMTWPIILVHYLTVMGYTDEPGWKGFYPHALQREYYLLSAGRKLVVLQILCDDVLDSEEIRAEIDMREESEVGIESDINTGVASVAAPRIVHPRYAKTSACKDHEEIKLCQENSERKKSCTNNLESKVSPQDSASDQHINSDECRLCGMEGTLLCCDGCPSSYHARCIGVSKMYISEGAWYCPECRINEIEPEIMKETTLKGAEIFGVDSYGQIFMGTRCHLLVLKTLAGSNSLFRYYNEKDIPTVLRELSKNVQPNSLYLELCKGIMQYWKVPVDGQLFEIGSERSNGTKHGSSTLSCDSLIKGSPERENTVSRVVEFSSQDASSSNFSKEPTPTPSELMQQNDRHLIEIAPCTSRSSSNFLEQVNSNCAGVAVSPECEKAGGRPSGIGHINSSGGCLYMGSSFRPQQYINSYLHGDFAASAAANLAELSSETESHASDKRQTLSANISLQTTAFSSAVTRFFWPGSEKKNVEVPRERCTWCIHCKAAVSCKKGCLLNSAASNAIKGAMKILSGLRPASGGEGNLPYIATYVILMEESLTGLTVGPFLNTNFRKQWRKQAEEATSFTVIKSLLLKFEENIRSIAFSGDWFKLVDDGASESFIIHSATGAAESTEKRKPGRSGRKKLSMVKVSADKLMDSAAGAAESTGKCEPGRPGRKQLSMVKVSADKLMGFTWWRGGMLSKLILQKATLPRLMLKKAARHGGHRRIPGIYYAEGSETPKRSRQLVWRAAVDLCKTVSQLALQVRYLDMHVRWSDLARPDQSLHDGKGSDAEASAFRNASIRHKRIVGNEVNYSVAFENQKHVPSRLMKSIIEVEQSQEGGKEYFWFSESRIPLYLIKDYEENLGKGLPSSNKLTNALLKLQKRSLAASHKDIFSYLVGKRDGNVQHCCASCQVDVLLRNAVKCNTCQGLCHKQCTISSTVVANEEVEFMTFCKQCYQSRALTQAENSHDSPTSPAIPVSAKKGGKFDSRSNPSVSMSASRSNPSVSMSASRSDPSVSMSASHSNPSVSLSALKHRRASTNLATKRKPNWGVIWRKNNEDTGNDFRSRHILLKGNPERDLLRPSCKLCSKPYDPYLAYIRCETCMNWFHADAVELEESKIVEAVGFKCCRCRRVKIPMCPYLDAKSKFQLEEKRFRSRPLKMDSRGTERGSGFTSELQKGKNPHIVESDTSRNSSTSLECGKDVEFEPQTYFSFDELLAPDDENTDTFYVEQDEPAISTISAAVDTVPCKICSQTEPWPELCCETCEIWIHRQCSPWLEEESDEDDWKCGNCRDWR